MAVVGEIRINTSVDAKGAQADIKKLNKSFARFGKALSSAFDSGAGRGKALDRINQQLRENQIAINATIAKMRGIEQAAIVSGDATSKAYESAATRVKQTELELDALGKKMDEIEAKNRTRAELDSFGNPEKGKELLYEYMQADKEYQRLEGRLEALNLKLDKQTIAQNEAKQAAINSTGAQSTEYKNLEIQLDKLVLKQEQLTSRVPEPHRFEPHQRQHRIPFRHRRRGA